MVRQQGVENESTKYFYFRDADVQSSPHAPAIEFISVNYQQANLTLEPQIVVFCLNIAFSLLLCYNIYYHPIDF